MAKIDFGGVLEEVITRDEFPLSKAQEILKNEIVAVIGYGVQGPAQALNMKDNGINVLVGQAPEFKADWNKAIADGFVPGKHYSILRRPLQKEQLSSILFRMRPREFSGRDLKPASGRVMPFIFPMAFLSPIKSIPALYLLIMLMSSSALLKGQEQASGGISLPVQESIQATLCSRISPEGLKTGYLPLVLQ